MGILSQIEQKKAELAALQALVGGRERLKLEAGGDAEVTEDEEIEDVDDAAPYEELSGHRIGPARTVGWDSVPLSAEG